MTIQFRIRFEMTKYDASTQKMEGVCTISDADGNIYRLLVEKDKFVASYKPYNEAYLPNILRNQNIKDNIDSMLVAYYDGVSNRCETYSLLLEEDSYNKSSAAFQEIKALLGMTNDPDNRNVVRRVEGLLKTFYNCERE